MSILSRLTGFRAVATLALAVVLAACGSAAASVTPPTAAPAATAASSTVGTPVLVDPFTSAGIATTVDSNARAVDPSTYRTTIPGTQYKAVYVVFALKEGAIGKVTMVMTLNDVEVLQQPLAIDYGTINSWGDFKVNFPDPGIPAGTYKAVMTYEPTGAQVIQFFTVT